MKLPEFKDATGVTTIGLTGITILAGVIFADLSSWWLILSFIFIMMGVGLEAGTTDAIHRKNR